MRVKIDWDRVDWTASNRVIAAALGVHETSVCRERERRRAAGQEVPTSRGWVRTGRGRAVVCDECGRDVWQVEADRFRGRWLCGECLCSPLDTEADGREMRHVASLGGGQWWC